MMQLLIPYFIVVAVLTIVSVFVVYNFLRYRFKGDKTLIFVALLAIFFTTDILFTLIILNTVIPPTFQS